MKKQKLTHAAGEDLKLSEALSESMDSRVLDNDVFIRKTFESDPKEGCTLLFQYYYSVLCSHAARFVYSQSLSEDRSRRSQNIKHYCEVIQHG